MTDATHVHPDGRVTFKYHHHTAERVSVAGNFSGWMPIPLRRSPDGWWSVTLGPGEEEHLFYKFIVDGHWCNDQFNMRRTLDGADSLISPSGRCGYLYRSGLHSVALGRWMEYTVYLPPSFFRMPERMYPVVYLLPGLLDDDTTWFVKGRVHEALEACMAEGTASEMVLVGVDKDDHYLDRRGAPAFVRFLLEDLDPHCRERYRTFPDHLRKGVEGLSIGGAWSCRLALSYPEHFGSASILSAVMDEEAFTMLEAGAARCRTFGTRLRLACGTDEGDVVVRSNAAFAGRASKLGLYCEFHVYPGPHDWPLWRSIAHYSMMFHSASFAPAGGDAPSADRRGDSQGE